MYIKDIPTVELESYFRMTQTIIDMVLRTNPVEAPIEVQSKLNYFNRIKKMLLDEIIERLDTITNVQPS